MQAPTRKVVLKDVEFLNVEPALDDEVEELRVARTEHRAEHDEAVREQVAKVIGENLARLRVVAGLGVDALAARSGVRAEQVALVESGGGIPGLRMLWRLAKTLGVPFGALLDGTILSEVSEGEFRVQRAHEGHVLRSSGGFASRVLSPQGVAGAPEVYELALRPGGAEVADGHGAATCEHIIVTAGQLVVQAGERQIELNAGDAVFFRADVPHRYVNPGGAEVRALLIMTYA